MKKILNSILGLAFFCSSSLLFGESITCPAATDFVEVHESLLPYIDNPRLYASFSFIFNSYWILDNNSKFTGFVRGNGNDSSFPPNTKLQVEIYLDTAFPSFECIYHLTKYDHIRPLYRPVIDTIKLDKNIWKNNKCYATAGNPEKCSVPLITE